MPALQKYIIEPIWEQFCALLGTMMYFWSAGMEMLLRIGGLQTLPE